jgi:hypothetical protein
MYTKTNKEIYRFKVFQEIEEEKEVDVEKEVEVEKEIEVEKTRVKEDGTEEKYKDKEKRKVKEKQIVKETRTDTVSKEYTFVIKQPTRRQMEEADMEYSIEMSRCVKNGILTKAMLMNKYSDTGGMLSESDAQKLSSMYGELGEIQTEVTQLTMQSGKTESNEEKRKQLGEKMATLRKAIAVAETNFSALLNHTADNKAQNKVISWYLLSLTYTEEDGELTPFFPGETFDDKKSSLYVMEEEEDDLLAIVYDKLTAFISFWYFSAAATNEDFQDLEKDIEEGNL